MKISTLNSWLTSGALLLSFVALLSLSAISVAQTGKVSKKQPASNNWTGLYAGLHLGYGMGNADTAIAALPDPATFVNLANTTLHPGPNGVIYGGQFGYNLQANRLVYGLEADLSASEMSQTTNVTPIIQNNGTPLPGGGNLSAHQDTSRFGTMRARIGFAATPRLLIYGTGGVAIARVNMSANTDSAPLGTEQYPAKAFDARTGWVEGGGAEFALSRRWSVKAEYLHYDLGNFALTANPTIPFGSGSPNYQVRYTQSISANLIKPGLNFRF
jgi:outer membrane immunogenic protein